MPPKPSGRAARSFECNTAYAADTARMLREMGFASTEVQDDLYGKPRFSCARRA